MAECPGLGHKVSSPHTKARSLGSLTQALDIYAVIGPNSSTPYLSTLNSYLAVYPTAPFGFKQAFQSEHVKKQI